jgi:hypothetical protein
MQGNVCGLSACPAVRAGVYQVVSMGMMSRHRRGGSVCLKTTELPAPRRPGPTNQCRKRGRLLAVASCDAMGWGDACDPTFFWERGNGGFRGSCSTCYGQRGRRGRNWEFCR